MTGRSIQCGYDVFHHSGSPNAEEVEIECWRDSDDLLVAVMQTAVPSSDYQVKNQAEQRLRQTQLDAHADQLKLWVELFNTTLSEIEANLHRLHRLLDDGSGGYQNWVASIEDVFDHLEDDLPSSEPPELEGTVPEDLLYDSRRSYEANVARIDGHRSGKGPP